MSETHTELLKRAFPELRKLEGRFLGIFISQLEDKVEDWTIWARLQLGKKKCFDTYCTPICAQCKHLGSNGDLGGIPAASCSKHPELGQTWAGEPEDTPGTLQHPNTGEWYWCIRECPDYEHKDFPEIEKATEEEA